MNIETPEMTESIPADEAEIMIRQSVMGGMKASLMAAAENLMAATTNDEMKRKALESIGEDYELVREWAARDEHAGNLTAIITREIATFLVQEANAVGGDEGHNIIVSMVE